MQNKLLRIALRALLVVSLLANAAVVGIYLRATDLRDRAGLENTRLPADIRRAFVAAAEDDPALWTQLAELGDARRAMLATIEAEPFDRDALIAAMAEVRRQTAALQTEGQRLMLEVVDEKRP